jgi:hypothetical protein
MLHTYYYQRHPSFLGSKTPPSYVGGYLHALHDFSGFLKNENHQAQVTYMKSMSLKTEIQKVILHSS